MSSPYDVVVVGAGITGASTAYHLKALGVERVLLLERDAPAAGGTGKSAAIVRQHYSTPLMSRLALESIELLEAIEISANGTGSFVQSGYMMLVPPELRSPAQENITMQRTLGIETDWLDDAEIARRAPWLDPQGVGGVVYEARGGYADPVRVTAHYVEAFTRLGGEIRLKTPCRAIVRDSNRVTAVLTEEGEVGAGTVVNAAGPWAKPLAETAGIEMPLRAVREQDSIWQARENRPLPEVSISNAVDAIYLRPLGDARYVIGQGFPKDYVDVDPYNFRETVDDEFVPLMQSRAERRFPNLQGMRIVAAYAALYDVTPDWYPFIGPRLGLDGYADACGGSGHGFKVAPAIGRSLARWIVDGRVEDDFARLSHDRLAEGRLFRGAYGGNRG